MELESKGYFAIPSLSSDPRWRHGQTYLFDLDLYGYRLFSGNPLRHGQTAPELVGARIGSLAFGMRDLARVADTFGETFLYFPRLNLAARSIQTKMTLVTRAVVCGVPILVGSGYFLDERPVEGRGGARGIWHAVRVVGHGQGIPWRGRAGHQLRHYAQGVHRDGQEPHKRDGSAGARRSSFVERGRARTHAQRELGCGPDQFSRA